MMLPQPVKRILVVDDVPEIGDIFRATLRRVRGINAQVVTEVNSARARELVRKERFDVIVSDYRMREINGLELLAAAREHHPDGLRILMTGYHDIPCTADEMERAKVDAYLSKPVQSQELLLLLLSFLQGNVTVIEEQRMAARALERESMQARSAHG